MNPASPLLDYKLLFRQEVSHVLQSISLGGVKQSMRVMWGDHTLNSGWPKNSSPQLYVWATIPIP